MKKKISSDLRAAALCENFCSILERFFHNLPAFSPLKLIQLTRITWCRHQRLIWYKICFVKNRVVLDDGPGDSLSEVGGSHFFCPSFRHQA
jgi:hypothetical protein